MYNWTCGNQPEDDCERNRKQSLSAFQLDRQNRSQRKQNTWRGHVVDPGNTQPVGVQTTFRMFAYSQFWGWWSNWTPRLSMRTQKFMALACAVAWVQVDWSEIAVRGRWWTDCDHQHGECDPNFSTSNRGRWHADTKIKGMKTRGWRDPTWPNGCLYHSGSRRDEVTDVAEPYLWVEKTDAVDPPIGQSQNTQCWPRWSPSFGELELNVRFAILKMAASRVIRLRTEHIFMSSKAMS